MTSRLDLVLPFGNKTPMTSQIFDRALLRRRRERALNEKTAGADFLLRYVADDLSLRLQPIKRHFDVALDALSPTPLISNTLKASGQVGEVVRLAPSALAEQGDAALFVVGDDEIPPFAAECFSLIVSAFSLAAINDVPGTLIQLRRMLKPDGLLMAVTLGGETLSELRQAFAAAESAVTGGVSPRVFPFIDVRDMGSLLQRAGFALPVCDAETLTVRYGDIFGLFRDLRAMAATNILVERRRAPMTRSLLFKLAETYQQMFAAADGRLPASFELIWAMGWAPHDSQQKPLKPGTAQMRLADALKSPD